MSEHSFDEKYFDNILRQVALDLEEEDIKKSEALYFELMDKPAPKTSLRHRWRMKKLINSYKKKNSVKKRYPIGRAIATAALAVVIVFSTGVFASADIFKLFQWLGFYSEEYVDISLSKDYTRRIVEETASWQHGKVYVPGLIPDGYTLDKVTVGNNTITMSYISSINNYFRFSMKILGDDYLMSVDNDNTKSKKIKVNGYDAIYFENDTVNTIGYNTNEYFFSLTSGTLGEKELKRIAENIETLDKIVVK